MSVEFPTYLSPSSNSDIPMVTAFYRGGTFTVEAFQLAMDRAEDPSELSVVSGGSSVGTELYGLAALYEGRLDGEGYDINTLAVNVAKEGIYRVYTQMCTGAEREAYMAELGFEVLESDDPTGDSIRISVAPLDVKHDIAFVQHDLLTPLHTEEPKDLVLANNLLYHLEEEDAATVVRNLADVVADQGVISVGEAGQLEASYRRQATADLLETEYGMTPLIHDNRDYPVAFGRA